MNILNRQNPTSGRRRFSTTRLTTLASAVGDYAKIESPCSSLASKATVGSLIDDVPPQLQELGKTALSNGSDEVALEIVGQPRGARLRPQIQEGVLRLLGMVALMWGTT